MLITTFLTPTRTYVLLAEQKAKRLAKEEAEDMMAEYEDFAMSVAYEEFGDD